MHEQEPIRIAALSVRKFFARFPNDDACLDHIMSVRFGGTTIDCPSCGCANATFHKLRERRVYACPECRFQIAPTANTILHDTRTPLVSWFYAMYLFCTTRHGVSGKELQRQLGVTYKTGYRIGMQIRKLTEKADSFDALLSGHVELDEACVGGRVSSGKRGHLIAIQRDDSLDSIMFRLQRRRLFLHVSQGCLIHIVLRQPRRNTTVPYSKPHC